MGGVAGDQRAHRPDEQAIGQDRPNDPGPCGLAPIAHRVVDRDDTNGNMLERSEPDDEAAEQLWLDVDHVVTSVTQEAGEPKREPRRSHRDHVRRSTEPFDFVLDLGRSQSDGAEREPDAVLASQHIAHLQCAELSAGPLEAAEHEQQLLLMVLGCRHGCDASGRTITRACAARRVRPLNSAGTT